MITLPFFPSLHNGFIIMKLTCNKSINTLNPIIFFYLTSVIFKLALSTLFNFWMEWIIILLWMKAKQPLLNLEIILSYFMLHQPFPSYFIFYFTLVSHTLATNFVDFIFFLWYGNIFLSCFDLHIKLIYKYQYKQKVHL